MPAVSLPLHRTDDGLPVGVMLAARPAEEHVLLAASAQLEAGAAVGGPAAAGLVSDPWTTGDARGPLVRMSELTPYLCVADARAAIDWYVAVLGAEVTYEPIVMADGRVGHVELAVDGARWMMSEEFAEAGVAAPDPDRGAAVSCT